MYRYQTLSEDYIVSLIGKIDKVELYIVWTIISQYQTLSEDFIIEFKNEVDWWLIFRHQNLSDKFISNNKDRLIDEIENL